MFSWMGFCIVQKRSMCLYRYLSAMGLCVCMYVCMCLCGVYLCGWTEDILDIIEQKFASFTLSRISSRPGGVEIAKVYTMWKFHIDKTTTIYTRNYHHYHFPIWVLLLDWTDWTGLDWTGLTGLAEPHDYTHAISSSSHLTISPWIWTRKFIVPNTHSTYSIWQFDSFNISPCLHASMPNHTIIPLHPNVM